MANAFGVSGAGGGFDMSGLLELLTQGAQSPVLEAILGPLLKIQERSFKPQQQNLTDIFRNAGALRDTSYGKGMGTLLGDQALAKQGLIGSTAQGFLGPLLQALMISQRMNLSAQARSSGSGWADIPPSQGLQTPMSGSSGPGVGYERGQISPPGSPAAAPGGKIDLRALLSGDPIMAYQKLLQGTYDQGPLSPSNTGNNPVYPVSGGNTDPWAGWTDQDWSNFLGE